MESLDITISSRNADLSEALVAATRMKISRLSRLGNGFDRADVHFYEEQNPRIAEREVCEVWMNGSGRPVGTKVSARDGFAAVDLAVGKLEQQLHKIKTRKTLR
jgi:ribosomal subunit interface protein